jgi:O-acetyl-ADP-ribose deacetylase (regulator of RNase III)
MSNITRLEAIIGDITKVKVDVIVNAANSSLLGGGGVDGAIHRAGGPSILEDCKKIIARQGGCKTGEAVITTGGNLPARYVIHTVGPVWNGGNKQEPEKLVNCYKNSLKLAVDNNCKAVAFPSISTGIYNFPKDRAAIIAVDTVASYVKDTYYFEKIVFVCFDKYNYELIRSQIIRVGGN